MSTSRQRRRSAGGFVEQALAMAWGVWAELGVSGWTRTHGNWAVDPEPLILFTAWLGDEDPRLRDETSDWCIQNWRLVSKTRLKNLLRRQPEIVQQRFGEYAATVATHAGITWPGMTKPRTYAVTGRSILPPLERPSLAWLRVRVIFGLGARAEILRVLLSREDSALSVARLADLTGYTKRNVAEECEMLRRGSVLSVRPTGNRFYYQLARRSELATFVGALPKVRPESTAVFNVTRELLTLEQQIETGSPRTVPVKARETLRRIEPDLRELDIEPPSEDLRGDQLWPAVRTLASDYLGSWATGSWSPK
jgi:hypothetical protein